MRTRCVGQSNLNTEEEKLIDKGFLNNVYLTDVLALRLTPQIEGKTRKEKMLCSSSRIPERQNGCVFEARCVIWDDFRNCKKDRDSVKKKSSDLCVIFPSKGALNANAEIQNGIQEKAFSLAM